MSILSSVGGALSHGLGDVSHGAKKTVDHASNLVGDPKEFGKSVAKEAAVGALADGGIDVLKDMFGESDQSGSAA